MITIGSRESLFSARLAGPLFEGGTRDRALFEMVKAVERASLTLTNEIADKLKGNEREFGIQSGNLFRAMNAGNKPVTIRGDEIEAIVTPGPLKYAGVINDGRGANKRPPPVKAIELWLRRKGWFTKGVKAAGSLLKKSARASTESIDRGIKSAAFAIARAIGKRGFAEPFTKGLHYVERGTEAAAPKVQQILERGRDRYVAAWNLDNAGGLAGV